MAAATNEPASSSVEEHERKYESQEPLDRAALSSLVSEAAGRAGLVVAPAPDAFVLSATYHDTADLRLLRRGITLRRRRGGHDAGWHLKVPVGTDRRDESREPLGRAAKPPASLVARTRGVHRGAPLAAVVQLVTDRQEWSLVDDAGRPAVLLADDRVDATTSDTDDSMTWTEVEVELTGDGTVEMLDAVETALVAAGLLRSASSSKLGRVLGDRLPPRPPPPVADRTATAGEAVLAYVAQHLEAMQANDPLARQGSVRGVHQMRVAARRMRSALQAFRTVLDRERTDPIVDELRWLSQALGEVRDLDVQEQRLTKAVAALPPELVLGPVVSDTERWFAERRVIAASSIIDALDSERYGALLDEIDRLVVEPPLLPAGTRKARAELPKRVRHALRRAERARREVGSSPEGRARDDALHELRKSAKRLRYTAEVAAPVIGKGAERLVKRVKSVQEHLGEHQDSVVARRLLRELGAASHAARRNGFTFGWLHREEVARAQRAEAELGERWRGVREAARTLRS